MHIRVNGSCGLIEGMNLVNSGCNDDKGFEDTRHYLQELVVTACGFLFYWLFGGLSRTTHKLIYYSFFL